VSRSKRNQLSTLVSDQRVNSAFITRLRANRDARCVRIIAEPPCDEWDSNSINAIQIMQRAPSDIRYLAFPRVQSI